MSVSKVTELELHWSYLALFPDAEKLLDSHSWLRPDFATDDALMKLALHALVVKD